MSLNVPAVKAVKVLDPRLVINNSREYVALKGSQVNSWQQFFATNLNNNNVQITCNPPNRNIAISRLILKKFVFDITVSGTNTSGGPLLNAGYYAPRAYPISAVTSSEQMTIANDTITQAPISQYWPAMLRYHNNFEKSRFGQLSLTPSMLDQFQLYTDGVGSVRNPLSTYGDNSYENARGGYAGLEVLSNANGATTATLRLTVHEPIMISPFVFGQGSNDSPCLVGVENMAYTATLGDLSRVLSLTATQGVGTINITSVVANLSSASLLFEYLTPDPLNPIPSALVSPYASIVSYPTKSSVAITPGSSVSLTMQSVQVTSIPRRLYIFARDDDSALTAFSSDTFMSLSTSANPLTMTWNNNQFFSQATTADLYNISVKNGCNMSYSQFTNFCGSVVCLEFGTDVGLMADEAPGLIGNYQLGITAQFTNTRSTNITPTLYVVVVYEGTFNVSNGNCSHMIGVLSHSDVLNSQQVPGITYKQAENIYGGDFFSSLKRGLRSAHDFVKKNKLISNIAKRLPGELAHDVASLASKHGYGVSGGVLVGGSLNDKKLSKEELKRRIRAQEPKTKHSYIPQVDYDDEDEDEEYYL